MSFAEQTRHVSGHSKRIVGASERRDPDTAVKMTVITINLRLWGRVEQEAERKASLMQ